ncbi:hypothetical protein [uncultured Castellaniella sp.]|uniref:hypothetical protein n=1 Tax=uncultured Castellaniella sp. TaxID=647907 RepID=UPI002612504D|nr:hypothetical protein [uncultured Castellaniella sp.]
MKKIAALAAALALAGCASSGVKVSDDQLSQFHEGQTTKQEVIAALGQPTTTMRNMDGTTTLMYSYVESRARPSTFIPIVGAFVGGADTRSNMVMMMFDHQDILSRYTSSSSQTGTSTGLATDAGGPVADQPRKP